MVVVETPPPTNGALTFAPMANIRTLDFKLLDELFDMGSGYVLDFSDRTITRFFEEELNVDFDNPIYAREGTSKAKNLSVNR